MASVFRRRVRGRVQKTYTIVFYDRHGVRRSKATHYTAKKTAEAVARELEEPWRRLQLFPNLAPELDRAEALQKTIADAKEELQDYLRDQGRTEAHVRGVGYAIDQAAKLAAIAAVRQITPAAMDMIRSKLIAGGRSNRTANVYIEKIKALRKFVEEGPSGRLPEQAKRTRRALTPAEFAKLMNVEQAIEHDRAFRYLLHARTGLRYTESGKLTWSMVDLSETAPRLVLPKGFAKNRKAAVLPLAHDLAHELRQRRPMAIGFEDMLLFPQRITRMTWIEDLKRAGIERENEDGMLGMHSLRDTYNTWLLRSGAKPLIVQWLMRHTGSMDGVSSLTTERYPDKSQFWREMKSAIDAMVAWAEQEIENPEEKEKRA